MIQLNGNILKKTLAFYNFGDKFINWTKIIYAQNHVFSTVNVNGHLSRQIKIERGVRQGCPLSPLLYILCTEPLANAIRQDANVEGVNLLGYHHILSKYADDTNFLLKNFGSLVRIFQIFQKF